MKKFNTPFSGGRFQRYLLVALLVVLAGCSSLRLSYNNGDTLLYWWLNAYVDLESDQKGWVQKDIDKMFHWHRQTQLKDYVQVLTNAQRQLQGNPTQADLLATYSDIKSRAQAVIVKAEPDLADLARSLRPEQIAQMEKKFAKNNEDYRKKYLRGDTAKRQKFRYQKSMEQFELWFGSFSREQEELIRQASDARPLNNELWFEERLRRQRNIISLVQKVQRDKLSKEATVALIHKLVVESFERMERSEHKAFFDAYNEGTARLVLAVIRTATPAQKAHAVKRMQGWIDDFNSLAADAR
jgi:hypothetical protein